MKYIIFPYNDETGCVELDEAGRWFLSADRVRKTRIIDMEDPKRSACDFVEGELKRIREAGL
jgi:hypothetical protein